MSSHANTIRLPEDKINARVKQLQHHMHFDAAMSMALRMEWEDDRRALLAENQRLRAFAEWVLILEQDRTNPALLPHVIDMARESLAGDAP